MTEGGVAGGRLRVVLLWRSLNCHLYLMEARDCSWSCRNRASLTGLIEREDDSRMAAHYLHYKEISVGFKEINGFWVSTEILMNVRDGDVRWIKLVLFLCVCFCPFGLLKCAFSLRFWGLGWGFSFHIELKYSWVAYLYPKCSYTALFSTF